MMGSGNCILLRKDKLPGEFALDSTLNRVVPVTWKNSKEMHQVPGLPLMKVQIHQQRVPRHLPATIGGESQCLLLMQTERG